VRHLHEAVGHEAPECVMHRRLADAELIGQGFLRQALAGLELAHDDRVTNRLVGPVGDRLGGDLVQPARRPDPRHERSPLPTARQTPYRAYGSAASRKPSPRKLSDRTANTTASPGVSSQGA